MTYTAAAALGVLAALAWDLLVLRTKLVLGRVFWLSYVIIVGFQLVVNGVLTSRGVVRYDPGAILGVRVAYAPVEDLAFGFALVLATLATWMWWERRPNVPTSSTRRSGRRGRGPVR